MDFTIAGNGYTSGSGSGGPASHPKAVDARSEFALLQRNIPKEAQTEFGSVLANFRSYVFNSGGSGHDGGSSPAAWSLADAEFLRFVDVVLGGSDSRNKVRILRLLATCSVRRDFQALLSSDRKRMVLLNYAAGFASLPSAEEQTAVALLFCNISSQHMGRSWLLYFSRWAMAGSGKETCNAEISTAVARESAQSYNPAARRYGVGLIFNLSLKDAAGYVEIENEASAVSQTLEGSVLKASQEATSELMAVLATLLEKNKLDEDLLRLCLAAMERFAQQQSKNGQMNGHHHHLGALVKA